MKLIESLNQKPSSLQVFSTIGWLCFLVATAATGIVFSIIDPEYLHACVSSMANSHRIEIYSIGFLFFWLITSCSCFISYLFLRQKYD